MYSYTVIITAGGINITLPVLFMIISFSFDLSDFNLLCLLTWTDCYY